MPPLILIPIAYAGLRIVTSATVDYRIKVGVDEAAVSAVQQITRILIVSLVEVTVNILLFLTIVYLSGRLFDYRTSVLLICSVYAGSLIHTVCKFIKNGSLILTITRDYRLNLKRYLFEQIYQNARSAAQSSFESMGLLGRWIYGISSGPGADTIAMRVTQGAMPRVWRAVLTRLLAILISVSIYVTIFRVIVSPILIQQTTDFNLIQAFLWPFAFSIDFFCNTSLSNWVVALK